MIEVLAGRIERPGRQPEKDLAAPALAAHEADILQDPKVLRDGLPRQS
jgi:hypothetical protein